MSDPAADDSTPTFSRRTAVAAVLGAATVRSASAEQATIAAATPDPEAPAPTGFPVGQFSITAGADGFRVAHQTAPDRVLAESAPGGWLSAAAGEARVRQFGEPGGSFTIEDTVRLSCDQQTVTSVAQEGEMLVMRGTLSCATTTVDYQLRFLALKADHLQFEVTLGGPAAAQFNRITLRLTSTRDEAFFGFGGQLTDVNQKGNLLPILVQEHGVGRGRPVITQIVDLATDGGGRNPYVTEMPAPHFVSSRLRSLCLEQTEYSLFDLRPDDHLSITIFAPALRGRIFAGATPLELIAAYTAYCGRMRALPAWTQTGAIVSTQGGTAAVRAQLDELTAENIPVAGCWIQDWTGIHQTNAGDQVWWNWQLDETHYPEWPALVADWAAIGARMLLYINPFLSTEPGHDSLYQIGLKNGYLVQHADGTPYLIRNTSFSTAMIDLSNPATRDWIQGVMTSELIGRAGASGWMADFGEALPFDAKLHGDADPATWHNHFTEAWAATNRAAIATVPDAADQLFFNRSGFTHSPGHSTLFWLGDQLESWDQFDGIKSAVAGMLSAGVSGFSLVHSDTGGYVSLSLSLAGHKLPVIRRTPELLMRWMELAAFCCVFRTHVGIDPAVAAQWDTNAETRAQFQRCLTIFRALAPYRAGLMEEAATTGAPLVRHLFLHFPDDPVTWGLRDQFMLGPDLMVAPVVDPGASMVRLYLPAGADDWQDAWTGAPVAAGAWHELPAPLGQPAVVVRAGSAAAAAMTAAQTEIEGVVGA